MTNRLGRLAGTFCLAGIIIGSAPTSSGATSYLFTVSCEGKRFVADWETGTVDPGKEYLRVATGTKNAGCLVADYTPARDKNLHRERYSDVGGVVQGFPPVVIICAIFHC